MALILNLAAYQKLIDEDLAWLLTCPRTLERDSIEAALRWMREHRCEFEGDVVDCKVVRARKSIPIDLTTEFDDLF